jgi:hypothetical protein
VRKGDLWSYRTPVLDLGFSRGYRRAVLTIPSGGVRVKGQSIVAFERTLGELKGDGAMGQVLVLVPGDVARAVRNREILPVGWYPMEWFAALHTAGRQVFGDGISREIGRTATRHDVTKLYRFILRFFTPDTLIGQTSRIFALFCDSGRVVIEERAATSARLRYEGCKGASRGVWDDVLGSTEILIELCGGRDPAGRIAAGGGDGDDGMTCVFSWT